MRIRGATVKNAREIFVHVFVRYGAGSNHWRELSTAPWFNAACWTLIVVGIIGWAVFLFWPY
jgi:hypothetical protein